MKNSFFSFLILLAFSTFIAPVNLVAQTKKVSTNISTTKGQPIVVSINGRRYQKVASNLQIGNLPKGRHYIEVFEFNKYADKNGGYAKLLYGGYVKMKAGKNYDVKYNDQRGIFEVIERVHTPMSDNYSTNQDNENRHSLDNTSEYTKVLIPKINPTNKFTSLINEVAIKESDSEKKQIILQTLNKEVGFTVQDLYPVLESLAFDESRSSCAKELHSKLTNPRAAVGLARLLRQDEEKNSYLDFLKKEGVF